MKHPTKQQVHVVMDNFEKVLPAAKRLEESGRIDVAMRVCVVYSSCNSPMCHSGWYAVAVGCFTHYLDGANIMALHLGFGGDNEKLIDWANDNPEIWGNADGRYLFCDSSAFSHEGSLTLQKIVDHWKGVQERLPV